MNVLTVSKLNYSIGINDILKDVSFVVNSGDRIGIVGVNGAGKSTLLKLIMGKLEADSGEISFGKGLKIEYLNLQKLEDEYYGTDVRNMSGGEKVRAALEGLFMEKPDLIILDEPTNHLDISALTWLEARLRNFRGTFLVVSHDRYFLDKVCTKIFEVENRQLKIYRGNYSEYKEQKRIRYEEDMRHYEQAMAELQRQKSIAQEFRNRSTEKMIIRAKAREKMIERMEIPERPTVVRDEIRVSFRQNLQTGNDVLITEGLGFGFDDRMLISDLDLIVKRGDRLCITGPNGCGKTTFLRMLLGELAPLQGRIKLGTNVVPAYYDQQQAGLKPENTVLEELYNTKGIIIGPGEYASVQSRYNETQLRKLLGAFCFRGDDVFKTVGSLAGGEKARLALLKLMMSGANVLILDEPTNHLDITSKEVFEDALMAYPGTEIIVSHDRYLIEKVATRIVALGDSSGLSGIADLRIEGQEKFGGGSPAASRDAAGRASANVRAAGTAAQTTGGTADYSNLTAAEAERQTKKAAETARRRNEKLLMAAEAKVAKLEADVAELEAMLCSEEIYSDVEKSKEISEKLTGAKSELESAYDEWMRLGNGEA